MKCDRFGGTVRPSYEGTRTMRGPFRIILLVVSVATLTATVLSSCNGREVATLIGPERL